MGCSKTGFPVHHPLPELDQTHAIESVIPFNHVVLCCPLLFLPSIFPSIRVFSNESVLVSAGQSIGVSASASVFPMNIQDWFSLGWTGWIFLESKTLSRVSSPTPQFKSINSWMLSFIVQLSHSYMTTGKTKALTRWTFVDLNMLILHQELYLVSDEWETGIHLYSFLFLKKIKNYLSGWVKSYSQPVVLSRCGTWAPVCAGFNSCGMHA